jgi:hypothetical protein
MSNKQIKKNTALKKTQAVSRPWTTGDFLLKSDGDYRKVGKVTKKEFEALRWNGEVWEHYGTYDWSESKLFSWTKLDKPIEEYEKDLVKELQSGFASFEEETMSNSTEVAITSGKDQATAAKRALEETTRTLAILEKVMNRKRNQLRELQSHFKDQLEKITRVVNIIELYLGVSEEIVQIAEGEPAPLDEPISIRQLCLHMDEEAADLYTGKRDGKGRHVDDIDFTNIEKFDDWVREHYSQLLPEEKGVVVCRPRRTEKDYRLGDSPLDAFTESEMNKENYRTYYLIRNGKNLYRISSDKIHVYPVLFPSQEEFKELSQTDENGEIREEPKKKLLSYQRNVLMLQGLLDRTDIFKPFPNGINLLNPETYGKAVRFIHDAESLLGTGRPEFWKWLTELNKKTQRGDRLYFTEFDWDEFTSEGKQSNSAMRRRFPVGGWVSQRPKKGLYNVVRVEPYEREFYDTKVAFICHFNPKDKLWKTRTNRTGGHEKERKNSIPFRLFPDDHCVINYEHITREDAEFYLKDRVNRQHYLSMIPLIRGILADKDEEQTWEDNFVAFVRDRFQNQNVEYLIREGISWWKTKVIEKRPLRKEDAKALRMIEGYVKRALKHQTTK